MLKRFGLALLMTICSLASTGICSARSNDARTGAPSQPPAPSTSSPEAARICPRLPADADIYWLLRPGPDFNVCYGVPRGSSHSVIGIYIGMYPSFRPDQATRIGLGTVAGHAVAWYQGAPDDTARIGTMVRQTLVHLHTPQACEVHAWLSATTRSELAKRLKLLARIRFQ